MGDPHDTGPVPHRHALLRALRHARHVPGALLWTGGIVVAVFIAVFSLSFADEPMRRSMEREINDRLTGYTVRVPKAHFQLFGLSVTLQNLEFTQQSNPDPPVAVIPRLRASLQWRALLSLRLVSDFQIDKPQIHINLPQFRKEFRDSVALTDRGWQAAAAAIYPFKINLLTISDADVVYIDADASRPLHLSHLSARAGNIRNIQSKRHPYPSTVHAEAVVFDKGRASIDGRANFLAQPAPTFKLSYTMAGVPLDNLKPIADRESLTLKGGTIASAGSFETTPTTRTVHISDVHVTGVHVDYHQALQKAAANATRQAARTDSQSALTLVVDTVSVTRSELGIARTRSGHPYRFFLSNADFRLTNYSNQFSNGPGSATLRGQFMGSGRTAAQLRVRSQKRGPNFDLALAIENTDLTSLNDLLKAYGKFDVAKGSVSFYSQLSVENGRLTGYAKPMIKDLKVYDWKQDRHNTVVAQLYELIVSGAAKLFENHRTGELATKATLNGPVGTTSANTWEVIGNAFENAFISEIRPGFERSRPKPGNK